jgi:hypothetical protein
MSDLLQKLFSRKLSVTLGALFLSTTPGMSMWQLLVVGLVSTIYVWVQGHVDRVTLTQATDAIATGVRQAQAYALTNQTGAASDDESNPASKSATLLVLLGCALLCTWQLACSPALWTKVLDARDLMCDSYVELADKEGLISNQTERLLYRAACKANPALASEAAEAAQAGEAVRALPPPVAQ